MISLNKDSLKQWQDENLEHLRYEYDVKPGELILDIGSYQREWSNEMIKRYDCIAECFDAIDNRAAWIKDGSITVGGNYLYTSFYDQENERLVECEDIGKYLCQEVAVCKINIEGGEYALLKHIISGYYMPNIRNLQVQFHHVEGLDTAQLYEEIRLLLLMTHTPEWKYPFCWESWKRNS